MVVLKKQSESYTYPGFSVATIYHFICPWRSSLLKLRLNHPKIQVFFKGAKARTKLSNIAPKDEKLRQRLGRLILLNLAHELRNEGSQELVGALRLPLPCFHSVALFAFHFASPRLRICQQGHVFQEGHGKQVQAGCVRSQPRQVAGQRAVVFLQVLHENLHGLLHGLFGRLACLANIQKLPRPSGILCRLRRRRHPAAWGRPSLPAATSTTTTTI